MFVRKDKDGNLIGVGSIDHVRLAQLQEAEKRKAAKAAAEAKDEPAKKPVEKEAAPDEPKTAKSPATPAPTKAP